MSHHATPPQQTGTMVSRFLTRLIAPPARGTDGPLSPERRRQDLSPAIGDRNRHSSASSVSSGSSHYGGEDAAYGGQSPYRAGGTISPTPGSPRNLQYEPYRQKQCVSPSASSQRMITLPLRRPSGLSPSSPLSGVSPAFHVPPAPASTPVYSTPIRSFPMPPRSWMPSSATRFIEQLPAMWESVMDNRFGSPAVPAASPSSSPFVSKTPAPQARKTYLVSPQARKPFLVLIGSAACFGLSILVMVLLVRHSMGGDAATRGGPNPPPPDRLACAPGCASAYRGDGVCDTVCNNAECGYDAGDCRHHESIVDTLKGGTWRRRPEATPAPWGLATTTEQLLVPVTPRPTTTSSSTSSSTSPSSTRTSTSTVEMAAIPSPGYWLMCPSPGQCGTQGMQQWQKSPRLLADEVPSDLASVPGVPSQAFFPVANHWTQSPPEYQGTAVHLQEVAKFMKELLASDPFGTGDAVPYVDFRAGLAKVVAITQRQLAFLVANSLMGNTIPAGDGLSAALARCSAKHPTTHGYLYSLLSLLAVLSRELKPGSQGTMLIAATPKAKDESWRPRVSNSTMMKPLVCTQRGLNPPDCGLDDFMAGGSAFQAVTDIAGAVVGGGAELCDVAASQDESLVQFYSEVLAFAFFAGDGGMLPVPWTLLGARRYVRKITGESSLSAPYFRQCGAIGSENWLNDEVSRRTVVTTLAGKRVVVPAHSFVAVASVCTGCIASQCSINAFVNNDCDAQRRHLDDDITLWYQAYEPTMYDPAVQGAFRSVVKRVGTGPWGAGVWYGDSQQYFLAVWLATSLLTDVSLDYYVYDQFCENPGNQCFVLGSEGCAQCLKGSGNSPPILPERCGQRNVKDMVKKFRNLPTQVLYTLLKSVKGPPMQVFDLLAQAETDTVRG